MSRIDFRIQERNRALFEQTDPGVSVVARSPATRQFCGEDNYIAPEAAEERKQTFPEPKGFFAKRRAVKEAGAAAQKMERLENVPDAAVRNFFTFDLPRLMAASQIDSGRVQKLLQRPGPWAALVQLACGDPAAFLKALENPLSSSTYLFALERVAVFKPKEAAHLVKHFFERGDLNQRLATLRTVVASPHLGDGHLVGEFFVKLMAASTPEERKNLVEPFFNRLLQQAPPSGKHAWLSAYYHGWKQEAPV